MKTNEQKIVEKLMESIELAKISIGVLEEAISISKGSPNENSTQWNIQLLRDLKTANKKYGIVRDSLIEIHDALEGKKEK